MKKQTVFVDLKGVLGDYVKTIYTQSVTSSKDIQGLQAHLNVIIKQAQALPATKDNCKDLWYGLTKTVKDAYIVDKKQPAYLEIVQAVDNIGNEIAYISNRKGLDITTLTDGYTIPYECSEYAKKNMYQALVYCLLTYTHKADTLEITKRQLLLMYHDGMLTADNSNYHLMTNDELVEVGNAFREKQRVKGYKTYDEVKNNPKEETEFKATGTDDLFFKE